jgi:FkbM family methyltransferase
MDRGLVFDVGAHAGDDTDFYLHKGFRVVAVEAVPSLCDHLRQRFASFHGQLSIVNAAISKDGGPVRFFANPGLSIWGTSHADFAARSAALGYPSQEIAVPGRRFQDILAEYGIPYYLKIDIEGDDMLCLQALQDFPDRPQYVSLESNKTNWKALLEEFELFRKLGYRKFKIVDQRFHKLTKPPIPAKEGQTIDYTFKGHCSGLFGEEIPGPWLNAEQAVARYREIFHYYRFFGDHGILPGAIRNLFPSHRKWGGAWYDTHASL